MKNDGRNKKEKDIPVDIIKIMFRNALNDIKIKGIESSEININNLKNEIIL